MLAFLVIGVALGVGTSVVPGPCGLAVLAAAKDHGRARAIATAFGAATGDAIYAGLGAAGVGRVLAAHPRMVPVLHVVSGAMVIAYAILRLWRAARPAPVVAGTVGARWGGYATGLALALANPAVVLTWVVLVGGALAGAPAASHAACVAGIACGTAAWGTSVALVAHRALSPAALDRVVRVVGVLLLLYGSSLVARGLS